MSSKDQKTTRWPLDSTVVAINDSSELSFWCNRFGKSAKEIKEAVRKVGAQFKDVNFYLNGLSAGRDRAHPRA